MNKHPMDGLREIEDKDKRIADLVDALKVAEGALDGIKRTYRGDVEHFIGKVASDKITIALEQIRKVVK